MGDTERPGVGQHTEVTRNPVIQLRGMNGTGNGSDESQDALINIRKRGKKYGTKYW